MLTHYLPKKQQKTFPTALCAALFSLLISSVSPSLVFAAEDDSAAPAVPAVEYKPNGYIRDDLFVYLHTGNGKKYRVQGSIKAGTAVEVLTIDDDTGYAQIIDQKGRTSWIEKSHLATGPGINARLASLQQRYDALIESSKDEQTNVDELARELDECHKNNEQYTQEIARLKVENQQIQQKLDKSESKQQQAVMVQGASIALVGILFGLLLPLVVRRRRRNDGWS